MKLIIQIARSEKLSMLTANMLPENEEVKRMCERAGFQIEPVSNLPLLKAVMTF